MAKDIAVFIESLKADIRAGIEKATEQKITRKKIVNDLTNLCVNLCSTKKIISDITDCINLDAVSDNYFKVKKQYKLQSVLTDLQSCIESITDFCADNKQ